MELKQATRFLATTGLSFIGFQHPLASKNLLNNDNIVSGRGNEKSIEKINTLPDFNSMSKSKRNHITAQSFTSLKSPISDQSLLTALSLNQKTEKKSGTVERLGSISIDQPAYLSLGAPVQSHGAHEKNQPKRPLYISGTGLFKSHVSEIPDISAAVTSMRAHHDIAPPTVLSTSFRWPNQISEIPVEIFNRENLLLITDGFLMPGKTTGNVYVLDKKTGETVPLLASKKGWFYHEAKFKDMNGDGIPDLLTARSNAFMLWKGRGELLWAEGREDMKSSPISEFLPMKEHVIGQGPDFFFAVDDIDHDGKDEIVVPEYSNEKLSIYKELDSEKGQWQRFELADGMGPLFDVKILQDNKNQKTILVTNHVDDLRAGLYALKRNSDKSILSHEGWDKNVVLNNIETRKKGPGQASPGSVALFFPHTKKTDSDLDSPSPYLFLSGDGSGFAYVLEPGNQYEFDEKHTVIPLVDEAGSMLGMPLAEHIDRGDAIQLMVPVFEKNRIDLFDYKPFGESNK